MAKVKMCGITNHEDMMKAVYYGAWAVGFIFYKKSPRYISASKVKKLIDELPPFVTPVGVFVNLKERAVKDICKFTGINTLQFHGDETPEYCKRFKGYKVIKAFRLSVDFDFKSVNRYKVDCYLFDTYEEGVFGGTGKTFNWDLVKMLKVDKPIILSGGITPDNIRQAVEDVNPYGIDVSSGIEKEPGIKDPKKIRALFGALDF